MFFLRHSVYQDNTGRQISRILGLVLEQNKNLGCVHHARSLILTLYEEILSHCSDNITANRCKTKKKCSKCAQSTSTHF